MPAFPTVGQEIGGYRIEEFIGRGGMSVVFLAEELALSRKIAIKFLSPELAEDEEFRKRFIRESPLAANMEHPNIIPIYAAGEVDELLFISMRYVQGSDLKALIKRQRTLPVAHMVQLISQVAYALDAAHSRELVHRDVKPGNILVASGEGPEASEHVYLSDFGLTKRTDSKSQLTTTGQFVGTIDYVAPEQIQGAEVTASADQYALACVAYECLAGAPPFARDNEVAVMYAHIEDPPPDVTAVRSDIPVQVGAALQRAMAKSPTERFENCASFIRTVREESGLPVSGEKKTPPVGRKPDEETTKKRRRRDSRPTKPGLDEPPEKPRLWIPVAALVLVGAVGAFLLTRDGPTPTPNNGSSETNGPDGSIGAFPAGTVAFGSRTPGDTQYRLATAKLDGTDLAPPAALCDFGSREMGPPDWHPDRDKFVVALDPPGGVGEKDIYVIDLNKENPCSEEQMIQVTDDPAHDGVPTWSPDGQKIAWSSRADGPQDLWIMDADGTHKENLTPGGNNKDDFPDFSPDGEQIAFQSAIDGDMDIYRIPITGGTDPIPITNNDVKDIEPDWSPGDRILYTRQEVGAEDKDIWVIGADGSDPSPVTSRSEIDEHATWVPGSDQLLFDSAGDLWTVTLDGTQASEPIQLTDTPESEVDPMTAG
jgi:serine/threonine protein kinase